MAVGDADAATDGWDDYSHVVSSQYRVTAVTRLATGPATPSQIADDTDVRITHISRALTELTERGVVDLLVSEDRKKGRVYGLNSDGQAVADLLEEHYL